MPTFTFSVATVGAMRWNGTSPDPNNARKTHPNHDSGLPLEEVKRLVEEGLRFFWQLPPSTLTGRGADLIKIHAELRGTKAINVMIAKGIHQRKTDPHIRIQISGIAMHIMLSWATELKHGLWSAVGVEVFIGKIKCQFPTAATRTFPGARRGSVTLEVMTEERKRAAKEYNESLASIHNLFEGYPD
ncbi:hypothetical protein ACO0LO_01890 [Undibacterium sp. TJN25]|uniref:hypothetical protein n=1 Tax=Undibacterium sp. TJN25 TaxID=3413056 RepID=UPI003BF45080